MPQSSLRTPQEPQSEEKRSISTLAISARCSALWVYKTEAVIRTGQLSHIKLHSLDESYAHLV